MNNDLNTMKRGQIYAYPATFVLEQTRTLQTELKLKFSIGVHRILLFIPKDNTYCQLHWYIYSFLEIFSALLDICSTTHCLIIYLLFFCDVFHF